MFNSFGHLFRITTFGESHGPQIGVIIDGCPAGLKIDAQFIQSELNRRKPGQSKITSARKESDEFEIVSGVFEGMTTGMPVAILIPNKDAKSKDYSHLAKSYRPSHADYTYAAKFGIRDYRGGGRSSARETALWVAAGAIAKLLLIKTKIDIRAYVSSVGNIHASHYSKLNLKKTDSNIVRCPDKVAAKKMQAKIEAVKKSGDTLGGSITCVVKNTPVGLGEPVFNKLHAALGGAMLSINAVKGFEYGSGFQGVTMKGSEHNDIFINEKGVIKTKTNHSGGIQGGISNGQDIYFKVAFKPVATIMQTQVSINEKKQRIKLQGKGRHDPCVVPRAVPIVEALTALVLTDFYLINQTRKFSR
jgi:chorismate synthase